MCSLWLVQVSMPLSLANARARLPVALNPRQRIPAQALSCRPCLFARRSLGALRFCCLIRTEGAGEIILALIGNQKVIVNNCRGSTVPTAGGAKLSAVVIRRPRIVPPRLYVTIDSPIKTRLSESAQANRGTWPSASPQGGYYANNCCSSQHY